MSDCSYKTIFPNHALALVLARKRLKIRCFSIFVMYNGTLGQLWNCLNYFQTLLTCVRILISWRLFFSWQVTFFLLRYLKARLCISCFFPWNMFGHVSVNAPAKRFSSRSFHDMHLVEWFEAHNFSFLHFHSDTVFKGLDRLHYRDSSGFTSHPWTVDKDQEAVTEARGKNPWSLRQHWREINRTLKGDLLRKEIDLNLLWDTTACQLTSNQRIEFVTMFEKIRTKGSFMKGFWALFFLSEAVFFIK